MDGLLKIPKRHKLIHPCEERSKYAGILDWLMLAIGQLKESFADEEELAARQQQLVVSALGELIELTRKECL
jgi:hypothetical protein